MNFKLILANTSKIIKLPILGREAHLRMVPNFRQKNILDTKKFYDKAKRAAVMLLIFPDSKGEANLLLIHRTSYPGVHSNQIGCPGGKQEPGDKDLLDTALRETEEEVGVGADKITVLRALTEVYIPPSNFLMFPYLGIINTPTQFIPEPKEVQKIIPVGLKHLLNDDLFYLETLNTSYAKNIEVPAFKLNGYAVWGATAMVLHELKCLLKDSL